MKSAITFSVVYLTFEPVLQIVTLKLGGNIFFYIPPFQCPYKNFNSSIDLGCQKKNHFRFNCCCRRGYIQTHVKTLLHSPDFKADSPREMRGDIGRYFVQPFTLFQRTTFLTYHVFGELIIFCNFCSIFASSLLLNG